MMRRSMAMAMLALALAYGPARGEAVGYSHLARPVTQLHRHCVRLIGLHGYRRQDLNNDPSRTRQAPVWGKRYARALDRGRYHRAAHTRGRYERSGMKLQQARSARESALREEYE